MVILLGLIAFLVVVGIFLTASLTPWVLNALSGRLLVLVCLWLTAVLFNYAVGTIDLAGVPDLSLARIIWLFMCLALFYQVVNGNTGLLALTGTEIAMLIFLVLALTSKFFMQSSASGITDPGISKFLNGYLFPFSMFFFAKQLVRDQKDAGSILLFLVWIGLYLSLTAIGEHFPFLSKLVLPQLIMDPNAGIHWGRARGPFLNAAVNGTVLGMIFPIAIFLGMRERTRPELKWFCLTVAALIPIALYFTLTRACWLGGLAAAMIMAAYYPKLRGPALAVLIVLAVTIAGKWTIEASTGTGQGMERLRSKAPIYNRIYLNDITWRMFEKRPLFGYGLDTFPHISHRFFRKIKGVPYYALRGLAHHNTFLVVLVELGVFGFLSLMSVYFFILKRGADLFRAASDGDPGLRGLAVTFGAASAVLFLNMFFIDMRFFAFPNAVFFILGGMLTGLRPSFRPVRVLPDASGPARAGSWPSAGLSRPRPAS